MVDTAEVAIASMANAGPIIVKWETILFYAVTPKLRKMLEQFPVRF